MLIEFCSAEQPQHRRNAQAVLGDEEGRGGQTQKAVSFSPPYSPPPLQKEKLRFREAVQSQAAHERLSCDPRDISPKGYEVFAQSMSCHIPSCFSRTAVPSPGGA